MAVQRLNDALAAPRVPHRLARRQDTGLQRRIAHELLRPQVRDQLVLHNHAIPMRDQVGQQLKDLGPHRIRTPAQCSSWPLGIEGTVVKHAGA